MNQNLIEAMTSIEMARALLFAYEKVFLNLDVEPESRKRADMAARFPHPTAAPDEAEQGNGRLSRR